jgi:hypothetical protein
MRVLGMKASSFFAAGTSAKSGGALGLLDDVELSG